MTSSSRGSARNRSGSGGNDTPSSTEAPQPDPDFDELRHLLVELRAGRRQADVAELAGFQQSKVSRTERGATPYTEQEADHYARTLGADDATRRRIVELSAAAHDLTVVGRGELLREQAKIQRRVGLLESSVGTVRSWQPELIPGPLQTVEYTAVAVSEPGEAAPSQDWLDARAARRAQLLERDRPFWHQLISEGALRWPLGDYGVMARQLEHLAAVTEQSNVQIGVLPLDTPLPFASPAPFHLYGRRAVQVAVHTRTSFLTDLDDVTVYEQQFDRLTTAALYGAAVRNLLRRLARRYRKQEESQ